MLSWLAYSCGEVADAVGLATRGIELATSTRSLDALCGFHAVLGLVAIDRNEFATARETSNGPMRSPSTSTSTTPSPTPTATSPT